MNRYRLPPDLRQLEQQLQEQRIASPAAALKQRILKQVSGELVARRNREARHAEGRWNFAAAVALVTLVCMNLSLLTAQYSVYRLTPLESTSQLAFAAAQIEELLPGISQPQALASAFALQSGNRLQRQSPLPNFSTHGDLIRLMNELDL